MYRDYYKNIQGTKMKIRIKVNREIKLKRASVDGRKTLQLEGGEKND